MQLTYWGSRSGGENDTLGSGLGSAGVHEAERVVIGNDDLRRGVIAGRGPAGDVLPAHQRCRAPEWNLAIQPPDNPAVCTAGPTPGAQGLLGDQPETLPNGEGCR